MSARPFGSTLEGILRKSELRNELAVAYVRFGMFGLISLLDCLAFFHVIVFTPIPPTLITVALDVSFFCFASVVLFILRRGSHSRYLKFFTITADYTFIAVVILFDPTVPKDPATMHWVTMMGLLFLFMLNLLRYSVAGTLYATALSVALFLGISIYMQDGVIAELFPMLFGFGLILFMGYRLTSSSKRMMQEADTKQMMARYFSPQLLGEFERKQVNLEPGGRDQEVTVLFSDIRSFTSISESLSAGEVVALLNEYLSAMTEVIFTNNGTIDKYIGDAIMTIFGAPVKSDDDAYRAVLTALQMQQALRAFNATHASLKEPLEMGIGIHTGDVIVGNIGSERRFDYTVIGDNVNLSSRIEGMTKYFRCPVLISGATHDVLRDHPRGEDFVLRLVDRVVVKGKSLSLPVYEVLAGRDDADRAAKIALKQRFEHARSCYAERDFAAAAELFAAIENDALSKLYAERCRRFVSTPPPDSWDGTSRLEEK